MLILSRVFARVQETIPVMNAEIGYCFPAFAFVNFEFKSVAKQNIDEVGYFSFGAVYLLSRALL